MRTLADLRLGVVLVLSVVSACTRGSKTDDAARDGGALQLVGRRVEVEPMVTPQGIDAWIAWQTRIKNELGAVPRDGGAALRTRAMAEAKLMDELKLDEAHVEAIEAVVSAVLAERDVARLTGAEALGQFSAGLAQLSSEQRAKIEAALKEASARSSGDAGMQALSAQFGDEAVKAVLGREAELRALNEFPSP